MLSRLLALCLLMAGHPATAASPVEEPVDMSFRNWTTREGLLHDRVRTVLQTRDGFIWLATDAGLLRFDGSSFKAFTVHDGLHAPVVSALYEDAEGKLWIGTIGGGISVMAYNRIERTYTRTDGLPSEWITGFGLNPEGRLLANTWGGLALFDHDHFIAPPKNETEPEPILPIARDGEGTLWGIGHSCLRRWQDGQWKADPGGTSNATAMCVDHKGRLWAFFEDRLWCRDAGVWTSHEMPAGTGGLVNTLAEAPDGTIWIAVYRKGLHGFKDGRFITPAPTPGYSPDLMESVIVTRDGQIWLTSTYGLYRMSEQRIRFGIVDDPQAARVSNNLGGLLEISPGKFLLATQGNGFLVWQDERISRLDENPELGPEVFGNLLYRTTDGTLWLGGAKGLYKWHPDQESAVPIKQNLPIPDSASIWAMEETGDGTLWMGSTLGQLLRIRGDRIEKVEYGGRNEPIKALAVEKDGTVWVGTRGNGLFRQKDGVWSRLGRETGLLSEVIRTLYLDPDGHLWVGTDGGGVALFRGDRFVPISGEDGLPSDSVSQITTDDRGWLWLGTHRGLAAINRAEVDEVRQGRRTEVHPILVNHSNGLLSEECTIAPPVKCADGSWAFATVRGFFRLQPDDFQPDTSRPPVFLVKLLANGNPVELREEKIQLPPGTERLEFEYSGIFFKDPDRLKFRTQLTGLDSGWVQSGTRRSAEYRNPGPGTFRFEVQASTGNGLWSEQPAFVEIMIAPHFWQTWWFRLGAVAIFAGTIVFLARHAERRRSALRIEALERRQAVDNERARIARDLHDDVGASLTQVALQSQLVERNLIRRPERAGEYLKEIFKTARETTRALDEIVWAVNPTQDTLDNFVSFLGAFVQDYTRSAGLRSRFDVPETVPALAMPPTVRHHLYLASKEILHNVIKHAHASEVSLKVTMNDGCCVIVIRDNGSGFVEAPAAVGADGLLNLRSRLEQVRGTCSRSSTPGEGTSVEMRIPIDWDQG
ncbi:hypothetical protein KBB96_10780 [Luteolibacter ambystomatis]|uniref:Histidine kinase/HSP90-like ATPase domain-containing protein n=1 Tax=Luteolibacter ambystomatis TaxID=2824561 RepID=A0A975G5X3_9BACT|nr:sensor histidine kinase [Luteolibacter ambystomatis]QUE49356.1 hypothetical protein KBB96_10780 [Luteolibacter ambystomatis]